jgi:hypothetical protein
MSAAPTTQEPRKRRTILSVIERLELDLKGVNQAISSAKQDKMGIETRILGYEERAEYIEGLLADLKGQGDVG